jgi:phage host-nuclease inhibitor protein Gam
MSEQETASGAEALEAYFDDEDSEVTEAWSVKSLADADWCLKRIADLQREADENTAIEALNNERLKLRTPALNKKCLRGVEFFTGALHAYAEQHRGELLTGKKRSRALAHGSIGWRSVGGGLTVLDKDKLLAWAKAQPPDAGLVRTTEAPALDAIKALAEVTGEVPDGTEANPKRDEFQAKPEKSMLETTKR